MRSFEPMNLAAAFVSSSEKHRNRPALFWGEQTFSYDLILNQSRQLAGHLQSSLGVKPGDRVALWLKNRPEFVPALFGTLMAGGAVVPINNFLKPDEVNHILADAGVDVVITDSSMSEALPKLSALRPQVRFWQVEEFAG